jgi:hypothetical protein
MIWLQDSILERLHHLTFSIMLSDMISKTHSVRIIMFRPRGRHLVYSLINRLNLSIVFPFFSTMLWTRFGLPHPSIIGIPRCMCTHPIDAMSVHLLHCAMAMSAQELMMQFATLCCHYTRCQLPCGTIITTRTSFNHVPLLSSTSWNCVHQKWNSHPSRRCHCQPNERIYFVDPSQPKDLLPLKQLKPKKWAIVTNTPLIDSSL